MRSRARSPALMAPWFALGPSLCDGVGACPPVLVEALPVPIPLRLGRALGSMEPSSL